MSAWVSGSEATRISGRNLHTLYKLALLGRLRWSAEIGSTIKFDREDCEKLARGEG